MSDSDRVADATHIPTPDLPGADAPPVSRWPADLDPEHREYLSKRAVLPDIARERGYASLKAGRRSANLDGTYSTMLGLGPHGGLLIPLRGILDPDGDDRAIRLPDGVADAKFRSPDGSHPVLATHPRTIDGVKDAGQPLIVAEGVTRVDALAGYGIPAVGIAGAYNWRGGKSPVALPDWDAIPLKGRSIDIALDGDITTNANIAKAAGRLAAYLTGRGAAAVRVLALPDKLGLDDWIAREQPADADALLDGLQRYWRPAGVIAAVPVTAATVTGDDPPADWYRVGEYLGETWLPGFEYDPSLHTWWMRDEAGRWDIVPSTSPAVLDTLMRDRHRIAADLDENVSREAADRWARAGATSGGYYRLPAMVGGMRSGAEKTRLPVPWHCIPLENGVLDLTTRILTPHDETDYRVTAVAGGAWDPDANPAVAEAVVSARLHAAIPDGDRQDALLWAMAAALGGMAGGHLRGSLIFLTGSEGAGKGNTIRYFSAAFGDLAMPGGNALSTRDGLNAGLAQVITRRARLLTVSEPPRRLPMDRILSVTGRDPIDARAPHKPLVSEELHTAVVLAAVNVPAATMDSGARRRLLALSYDGRAADRAIKPTDEITDGERAALLTVLIHRAMRLHAGETPDALVQESEDSRRARIEADPCAEFVEELTAADHGQPLSALLGRLHREHPETEKSVPSTRVLSRKLGTLSQGRLKTERRQVDGVQQTLLVHPDAAPPMPVSAPADDPELQLQMRNTENGSRTENLKTGVLSATEGLSATDREPCGKPDCLSRFGKCQRFEPCPHAPSH